MDHHLTIATSNTPPTWQELGFTPNNGCIVLENVIIRTENTAAHFSWHTSEKIAQTFPEIPQCAPASSLISSPDTAPQHPNHTTRVDHLVITTPPFTTFSPRASTAGFTLKNIQNFQFGDRNVTQCFARHNDVIFEFLCDDNTSTDTPIDLWGITFVSTDLTATKQFLDNYAGEPKPARQAGRHILTVKHPKTMLAVAFMTPHHQQHTMNAV